MAPWTLTQWCACINLPRRKAVPLSIVPICLACISCFLILLYVSFTFDNLFHLPNKSISSSQLIPKPEFQARDRVEIVPITSDHNNGDDVISLLSKDVFEDQNGPPLLPSHPILHNKTLKPIPNGSFERKRYKINKEEVYHDTKIFLANYKEMKSSLKIYIYPHDKKDPFAHALLPTYGYEPSGNYASESYFKNVLYKSHFITKDPSEADFFYLPFSIASLRHDTRIGVHGLPDFVLNYMNNVTQNYPYWNRSGGADHFYSACHSVSKKATDKVNHLKSNAIQVVCSSSYFLTNYYAHKDVSLPQIWPRHEEPKSIFSISQRKKLAFFAGSGISPLRKTLVETWGNDSDIAAHGGRLKTPYSEHLLGSKYCLHVKGFEVNTARIGDAMYYGCVPVILADYYDLPFMDILNWKSFSVVVTATDIPNLKKILHSISPKKYAALQANVLKVRKHFKWNNSPTDFDAFYTVMYELWLRRSSIKVMSFKSS